MVIITAWTLCKQRNARVFENVWEQKDRSQILTAIIEKFHLWELARRGGSSQIARVWVLVGGRVRRKCEWVLALMSLFFYVMLLLL
jgi:hypothetical protein